MYPEAFPCSDMIMKQWIRQTWASRSSHKSFLWTEIRMFSQVTHNGIVLLPKINIAKFSAFQTISS